MTNKNILTFENWYTNTILYPLVKQAFHLYQSIGTPKEYFYSEYKKRNLKEKAFKYYFNLR